MGRSSEAVNPLSPEPGVNEPTIDRDLLAKDLHSKIDREQLTLREAADQIGCGAATLSRLLKGSEADNFPDTTTLFRAASWLGHTITDYDLGRQRGGSTITEVEVHLRALPGLNQRDKEALIAMVRGAYDAASKLRKDKR